MGNKGEMKIPEPYSTIIEDVCNSDRQYFEAHPKKRSYRRPYVPGEFYPLEFVECFVIVHQIQPGVRRRHPHGLLLAPESMDDPVRRELAKKVIHDSPMVNPETLDKLLRGH